MSNVIITGEGTGSCSVIVEPSDPNPPILHYTIMWETPIGAQLNGLFGTADEAKSWAENMDMKGIFHILPVYNTF